MSKRLPKLVREVVNMRAHCLALEQYHDFQAELRATAQELVDAGWPLDAVADEILKAAPPLSQQRARGGDRRAE